MSAGHLASSIGGSFIHSPDNPFGPDALLHLDVGDNLIPASKVMVIPDGNAIAKNLQPFDSALFSNPKPPSPEQIWAVKAARTSAQLALLVALSTEMQETVGSLSRPEWQQKLEILQTTLKLAYTQAKTLCGAVDPHFKPPPTPPHS